MEIVKPIVILLILMSSMLRSNAFAHEPPPKAGAVRGRPGPEADLPKAKPAKRRAVHQIIDGMPPSAPPAAYGPRLPRQPGPLAPGPGPAPLPPIGNCDAGGCNDASGARYKGGVGTTLLSPEGRLCSHNGLTVQCF